MQGLLHSCVRSTPHTLLPEKKKHRVCRCAVAKRYTHPLEMSLYEILEFPPCVRHIFLILRWTFSKEEMSYVQRAEKVLS